MSVVDPQTRADVRAYVEGNMLDAVSVRRPSANSVTLDPATGLATADPGTVIYTGKARVKLAGSSGFLGTGAGDIAQRQCAISVPIDAPETHVDDLVAITAQADPSLVGTVWRVVGVSGGGIFAAFRELSCAAWVPSSSWAGTG